MGVISRMREVSPYVLILFVVAFIGFMALGDIDWQSISNGSSDPASRALGEVNGEKIMYQDFLKRVKLLADQQRRSNPEAEVDEEPLRQQVWDQMVQEVILRQQAEKAGIIVTDAELQDLFLENPPDYLTQSFRDSTGKFDRKTYIEVLTDPDNFFNRLYQNAPGGADSAVAISTRFKRDIVNLQRGIREQKFGEYLNMTVGLAASIVSPTFLKQRYIADNSVADLNFVFYDAMSVPEKDVPVSDEEIRTYYESNKQYYKQKAGRKLRYITFPITPSKGDSANTKKKVNRINDGLLAAVSNEQRDSVFRRTAELFGSSAVAFTPVQSMDPVRKAYLVGKAPGDVVGPASVLEGTFFFRVDSIRTGVNELASVAHVLIKFGNNKDSALAIAKDVVKRAKAGEDFATLARTMSQDPGSTARGGVYDFFPKGRMVKEFEEASFNNAIGTITDPVETQFGYHIIKVLDKTSEEISYSEIKFATQVTSATKNLIRREALSAKELIEKGENIDSVAKRLKKLAAETPFILMGNPVLGSLTLTDFAYKSSVGDVAEPRELKNYGIVLAQLAEVRTVGTQPLEDVKDALKSELMNKKRLDKLEKKAKSIYSKIASSGLSAISSADPSVEIRTAAQIKDNGTVPGLGFDPVFTASVFSKGAPGKTVGPVRGMRGVYIYQVISMQKADESKFAAESKVLAEQLTNQARQSAYYRWINKQKELAEIVDHRAEFFGD